MAKTKRQDRVPKLKKIVRNFETSVTGVYNNEITFSEKWGFSKKML
jgi:hypothetical protein